METCDYKKIQMWMFIAVLFIIVKTKKKPETIQKPIKWWTDELWHNYKMEYYAATNMYWLLITCKVNESQKCNTKFKKPDIRGHIP